MRRVTQTLTILHRVEGETDWTGNPKDTWEPVPWPVYAVAPRAQQEPGEANRESVLTGVTVFAPADGPTPAPTDRVAASDGGRDWEVVGEVGRWDNNPHVAATVQRGIVVNLQRTEG